MVFAYFEDYTIIAVLNSSGHLFSEKHLFITIFTIITIVFIVLFIRVGG